MRRSRNYVIIMGLVALCGCMAPRSFQKAEQPGWVSMDLPEKGTYESAWEAATRVLGADFDLEILSKENRYVRTAWSYTWPEKERENYRVRVAVRFGEGGKACDIMAEAEYGGPGEWVPGHDARLLAHVKNGILQAAASPEEEGE